MAYHQYLSQQHHRHFSVTSPDITIDDATTVLHHCNADVINFNVDLTSITG